MAYIACSRDWQAAEQNACDTAKARCKETLYLWTAVKANLLSNEEEVARLDVIMGVTVARRRIGLSKT